MTKVKNTGRPVFEGDKTPAMLLVVAGILVLIGGWILWQHFVFGSPKNTFWDMVDASLQTGGVTKHVRQEDDFGLAEQYLQLELGATNAAKALSIIVERAEDDDTTVVTETIGTPEATYVRYLQVESTGPEGELRNDFSPVIGVWGKEDLDMPGQQSVFNDAIYGVIPFAHLSAQQRRELINTMKTTQVYDVDYDSVKRIHYQNQDAFELPVSIRPGAYVGMLKQFDSMVGLGHLADLDASQYQLGVPIQVIMVVGINSRQLLAVTYLDAERTETYQAYGADVNITTPLHYISRYEIEQKLTEINSQ